MKLYTLDFETYYATDYSLRQKEMTIDRYVHDPRFKEHLLGIRWPDGSKDWVAGREIDAALNDIDWDDAGIICHHTHFDGYILSAIHGRIPKFYFDTISMARPLYGHETGVALEKLAEHLGIGSKGKELVLTRGIRDLPPELEAKLGGYCLNDVDLTWRAFEIMREGFPIAELRLIDLTIRMFTDPVFDLHTPTLRAFRGRLAYEKNELFNRLGISGDILRSDAKFAEALERVGIEPPTKINKNGETKFAFAKVDPGFKELLEHERDEVRWLAEARVGAKSTTDESRCQRLLEIAEAGRRWPIYLNYYKAGPGRWSGGNKVNPQNLRRGGVIRRSVVAPDGYVVLASDSSQIEARKLAYVAGQEDLTERFANGEDVYAWMASLTYGFEVNKKDHPLQRFVGKTEVLGLGYGTGPRKLQLTLAAGIGGPSVKLELPECERIVYDVYRKRMYRIVEFWDVMEQVLGHIAAGREWDHPSGTFSCSKDGLHLPNGMMIRYPNLQWQRFEIVENGKRKTKWAWGYQRGRKIDIIHGAKATENIIQGLSRVTVSEQMLKIESRYRRMREEDHGRIYRIGTMSHDEVVSVVPTYRAEEIKALNLRLMSVAPKWAPGLPVAAEAGYARSYGEAKQ